MLVVFTGDKNQILDDTVRELKGQPFSGEEFNMAVAVLDYDYKLNPDEAVSMPMNELFTLAGAVSSPDQPNDLVYVPRIPRDAEEAKAMMQMLTIFLDTVKPEQGVRDYAGYTDTELRRGMPAVRIGR